MYSSRKQIIELIDREIIPKEQIDKALQVTGVTPDGRCWFHFVDRLLLWAGSIALTLSLLYFIAYNWSEADRLIKFLLVEMALVGTLLGYLRVKSGALVSQALLFCASLIVGVLLGLIGQIYQTGADPWQLFASWWLLILPWALVGRSAPLWLLWIALLNTSILLYYTQLNLFSALFPRDQTPIWLLSLLNSLALLAWEYSATRLRWLSNRWGARLLATVSGIFITSLVLAAVDSREAITPSLLAWSLWLTALYLFYRYRLHDLLILTGAALSAYIVIINLVIQYLIGFQSDSDALLIALIMLIIGVLSVQFLRSIHKGWQQ